MKSYINWQLFSTWACMRTHTEIRSLLDLGVIHVVQERVRRVVWKYASSLVLPGSRKNLNFCRTTFEVCSHKKVDKVSYRRDRIYLTLIKDSLVWSLSLQRQSKHTKRKKVEAGWWRLWQVRFWWKCSQKQTQQGHRRRFYFLVWTNARFSCAWCVAYKWHVFVIK